MAAFFKFSSNKHDQVGDTIKKTNSQTKDMQMWHIVTVGKQTQLHRTTIVKQCIAKLKHFIGKWLVV